MNSCSSVPRTSCNREIWSGSATAAEDSGSGQSDLVGMLVGAVVNQITTEVHDPSRGLSADASWSLFGDRHSGLLYGPYHEGHEEDLLAAREELEASRGSDPDGD